MRSILAAALFLCCSVAWGAEKSRPNTLTPAEIAEGWILLFDGETTFGWKVEGTATVKEGVLHAGGEAATTLTTTASFGASGLVFEVQGKGEGTVEIHGDRHRFKFESEADEWSTEILRIDVDKKDRRLSDFRSSRSPSQSLDMFGGRDDPIVPGPIRINLKPGTRISLRSIKLRPQVVESLFDGKSLAGWKMYDAERAGKADAKAKSVKVTSTYSVTPEGWLNVKNGPGDLQTERQWADFVLQFQCISNGKHLNSGLFFRCLPDLYQQGYEAQIRNEWMGDDRSKPVDFGTGAIYRRQPTRKVVSTDGEWFTMTIAARGRQISTWVNGYQTVDWQDDRPEAENARQGFKKTSGALSIQGHDPTTDLSFRDFRIQSLDPGK